MKRLIIVLGVILATSFAYSGQSYSNVPDYRIDNPPLHRVTEVHIHKCNGGITRRT